MYDDDIIQVDETGITIGRYGITRAAKRVLFAEIRSAEVFDMGVSGRWRVSGAGPGRLRSWYNWDKSRRTKTKAIALDIGGFFHPTVTPDDPEAFLLAISDHVSLT